MSYRRKQINHKIRGLRKKKKFFQQPLFWVALLLAVAGTGVVYFVFFLPSFQISSIQVSGNQRIQSEEIESLAWNNINKSLLGLPYRSLLLASTANISKDILQSFAMVETATVKKKMPNGITVTIKERKPYAVFCSHDNNCFSLDENGIIFGEPRDVGQEDFVVQKSKESGGVKAGDRVIDKSIMDGVVKIQRNFDNDLKIAVNRVNISDTLVFTTREGWKAYFDPVQNIQLQITKMDILLKDQISEKARQNLQYIYLQYKDRAYYK
ncbi:FtsQ-type POTRA domain-containing protein [Candidatus Parcubacteria bacterium]|nr:FtsQ-type POTRA domain-containing protein [Candidatus Parcubacteria bacterium]